MPLPNPAAKLEEAQTFLASGWVGNLVAQAHARDVLRHVSVPQDDWPHFRTDLDERLHHTATYLLWSALQLLEVNQPLEGLRTLLVAASEAWEYLSNDSRFDSPIRVEQVVNATFGYYLAGYYARSFVLLREAVPPSNELPPILGLLVAVFRKRLSEARGITIANFGSGELTDEAITTALDRGRLTYDDAYGRILLATATKAVSLFLEVPKNGNRDTLNAASALLDDAIIIAREQRYADWWWWLFCIRFLFREYGNATPWAHLGPLVGGGNGRLVAEYIRAGLRNDPPIIELWPSQVVALPAILDERRKDFVLKMPTSAGKTRIAEMTILRFLLDHPTDPDAKCLYVAPFRSLAVEVEQTLRKSLGPLGVTVSQLYGTVEVSPADVTSLAEYGLPHEEWTPS